MSRLILKSLLLLSVAVLSFGETVEVSPNGEATPESNEVICPPECASPDLSAEWKQKVAELERSNAGLATSAQSCKESTNSLSNQLQEAVKRAETVEAEKQNLDASCNAKVQTLSNSINEGAELRKTLEESTKECTATLDMAIAREKQFKEEADAHFTKFRAEIQDLLSHKQTAAEMAEVVKTLSQDLDSHKSELSATRDSLTKDLEDHRSQLREKSDSYSQSRKELFQANERLRELDLLVSTTYVNTTLIQRDIIVGSHKMAASALECWDAAMEALSPYWQMLIDFVTPYWNQVVVFYNETVLVEVSKAKKMVTANYEEHVEPTLKEHVFPVTDPVVAPVKEQLNKLHLMTSNGLQQGCQSLLHYLELMETKDSVFQQKVTKMLQWAEADSPKALNYLIWAFVIMFVLVRLRLRARRRRAAEEARPKGPAAKAFNRKGLRSRNKPSQ